MMIGEVIRKYRKQKELTQEEMANFLGVTAPAVNKWENGNAMPDITLLSPIARLLDVSLNELLSFKEELTAQEIQELTLKAEQITEAHGFDQAYSWAKKQIEAYPNCEKLIYSLALTLDAKRLMLQLSNSEKYDSFILSCYKRLLKSNDVSMRTVAADSLYNYYLRNEQYEKASEYLSFFSMQSPERKRKQAILYERSGETEKAYKEYEEILISAYQILCLVFDSLFNLKCKEQDVELAKYYTEKKKLLAELFQMGEFSVIAADLALAQFEEDRDKTFYCADRMLNSLESIYSYSAAPLFSHIELKKPDSESVEKMRTSIIYSFKLDDSFQYMSSDQRWNELLSI